MDFAPAWRRKTAVNLSPEGVQRVAGDLRSVTSPSTGKPQSHTLPKSEILRGYRIFGRIMSRGTYVQSDAIRCYYDVQREIPPYQCMVGFAVKKPGSAVRRNRLRRLLRESYRQRKTELAELSSEHRFQLRCVFMIDAQKAPQPTFSSVDAAISRILEDLLTELKKA